MVNNLIDAIAVKLNAEFGDGYKIYSDSVKQGLREPCFFISVLNPSESKIIGNRYNFRCSFDIHYFPAKSDNSRGTHGVGVQLFRTLDHITFLNGDSVLGRDMRYEVQDGVLHFFVDYAMILTRDIPQAEHMDDIDITTTVNG